LKPQPILLLLTCQPCGQKIKKKLSLY
jgi:hypothetical protein